MGRSKKDIQYQKNLVYQGLFDCIDCNIVKPLSDKDTKQWFVCRACRNIREIEKRKKKAIANNRQSKVNPNGRSCKLCLEFKPLEAFDSNSFTLHKRSTICLCCKENLQEKKCSGCQKVKDIKRFRVNKATTDGRSILCKECLSLDNKARMEKRKQTRILEWALGSTFSNVVDLEPIKYCPSCETTKPVDSFGKTYSTKSGRAGWCKSCTSEKNKAYRKREADLVSAANAIRRLQKDGNSPPWITPDDNRHFYKSAKELTESTGIKHAVDHIDPLKNPLCCGLNVPANLKVITMSKNASKSNKFKPYRMLPNNIIEPLNFSEKEQRELVDMLITANILQPSDIMRLIP